MLKHILVELIEKFTGKQISFAITTNALDFGLILQYHISNKYLPHAKNDVPYI